MNEWASDRQMDRWANRQMHRHANRETSKWTDKGKDEFVAIF